MSPRGPPVQPAAQPAAAAAATAVAAAAATAAAAAATATAAAATAAKAAAAAAEAAAATQKAAAEGSERPLACGQGRLQSQPESDFNCSSSSSSGSDGDASSVCALEDDDSEEDSPPASCLLCPYRCSCSELVERPNSSSSSSRMTPAAVVLQHMRRVHGLDLTASRGWLAADKEQRLPPLNPYFRIALVCFLRQQQQQQQQQDGVQAGAAAEKVLELLTPDHPVFSCPDELLASADPQDPLLWDGDDCSTDQDEPAAAAADAPAAADADPAHNAHAAAAAAAEAAAAKWEGFVAPVIPHNTHTYEQLLRHRTAAAACSSSSSSSNRTAGGEGVCQADSEQNEAAAAEKAVDEGSPEDKGYFAGYGELSIHREMISDRVRTEAYRDFILQQSEQIRGKVVLDVGCGSGILSIFAAQAGARKVIALDASGPIVSVARRVVLANGFSKTIQVVHAKASARLSTSKDRWLMRVSQVPRGYAPPEGVARAFACDCVVSEWMGYCLFYECMLFSVLHARDRYLKPEGLLVPNKALLSVSTADFREEQQRRRGPFGGPLYGLDFSALDVPDAQLFGQLEVLLVQQQQLNQQQQQQQQPLCLLDLHALTRQQLRALRFPFEISLPLPPEACSSLVFSFDCFFEPHQQRGGPPLLAFSEAAAATTAAAAAATAAATAAAAKPADGAVVMSTSPLATPTHWKQTVLHLLDEEGNTCGLSATPECPTLRGYMSVNPNSSPDSRRSVVVTLEMEGRNTGTKRNEHTHWIRSYPLV
ncbi:hypothetical protein Efla_002141 [Eimeria flavescens]